MWSSIGISEPHWRNFCIGPWFEKQRNPQHIFPSGSEDLLQVGSFIFRISIVQRADQPGRVSEWLFYNFYIIKYLFPVQKHIVSGRMVCQVDAVYWKIYGFFSGNSREFQEISISSLLLSKWSTFQFLCVWFQRLSCEFSCPFPYLLVAPLRVSCQWVFESFSFTNLRVDFPFHFREFRFSFPGQGVDLPFHFREFRFSVPFQRVDFPFYFRKFHFWEFLRDLHLHFWCLHKVPSGQTISYQS